MKPRQWHALLWLLILTCWVSVVSGKINPHNASSGASIYEQIQRTFNIANDRLEARKDEIIKDVDATQNYVQGLTDSFYKTLRQSRSRFKKNLARTLFHQRVGWNRLRHSIRDYVGFILGCFMAFRGYTSLGLVHGGAAAVQTSQLGWDILDAHRLLPHDPWLTDIAAIAIGVVSYKKFPQTMSSSQLPAVFLGLSLFQCMSLVVEEWKLQNGPANDTSTFVYTVLVTSLAFWGIMAANIPIPLASSSISGAIIAFRSARAEIAGNWLYMLEVAASLAGRVLPLVTIALNLVGRGALWVLKQRKTLVRLFNLDQSVKKWTASIRQAWKTHVKDPLDRIQSYIQNHPISTAFVDFCKRLQKAIRPIIFPVVIATLGIGVQMEYITGISSALRVAGIAMDPISHVLAQAKNFVNVHAQAKKLASVLIHQFHVAGLALLGKGANDQSKKDAPPPKAQKGGRLSNLFKRRTS